MDAPQLLTSAPRSVRHLLNPMVLARTVWRQRDLTRQLIVREVAQRYRGSVLGLLWSLLTPLALLAVYTLVFGVILEARFPGSITTSRVEYAITLFVGLLLHTLFAESLAAAADLIPANTSYVKRVVFPLEILPVVKLGAAFVHALISVGLLLVMAGVFMGVFSPTIVFFPLVLLAHLMLTLGLCWFLASVGVYVRDATQAIGVILTLLFFLTPIIYSLETLRQTAPRFVPILALNPLAAIVENARRTLLWGQMPEWTSLIAVLVVSAVVMQCGFVWFMKTKRGFADVL